jgi:hypothetical protein
MIRPQFWLGFSFSVFVSLSGLKAQGAKEIVPADSEMARADPQWQRILLSAFEADARIGKSAYRLVNLGVDPAPATVPAKCGRVALALHGEAEVKGAKGDFAITGGIPGTCQLIGLWVYKSSNANFSSVGIQLRDAEDEILMSSVTEDWEGWKWVEFNLGETKFEIAHPAKNGTLDFPIRGVNVIWRSSEAGLSTVIVDGLVAVTDKAEAPAPLAGDLVGGSTVEFGEKLGAQYLLTNFSDKPLQAQVDFSVQTDSVLAALPAPDPILGTDHALGAPSWTEYDGKKMEENSLTDGKGFTDYRLPTKSGVYKEAFQYIDLGRERRVTGMIMRGGDVNWIWKVDVAASTDGKNYKPVPDLQGVDFHGRWESALPFPVKTPFPARYVRLRYHQDGVITDTLAMFAGLSIYDGVADEKWEVPVLGKAEIKEKRLVEVPPHSFTLVPLTSPAPLPPGSYFLAAVTESNKTKFMNQTPVFSFPTVLKPEGKDSRFGLNGSETALAPMLRRLGVGWMRFENAKWPFVSSEANTFDFGGGVGPWHVNMDSILGQYTAQDLQIIPMMFMTPKYASSADASVNEDRALYYPPKDNALAADYYYQTAARYGTKTHPPEDLKTADKKSGLNRINVYEIWNEQDLNAPSWGTWVGTLDQYYEMFRPSAEAVKKADPSALVLNGGYTDGLKISTIDRLRSYKYPDGKCPLDFVDVLSVHYYSGRVAPEIATVDTNADRSGTTEGSQTYEEGLRKLVAWRDANKKKMPIWITETGYDSAGPFGTSERLQAARLPRVILMALAEGIEKVIIYRDRGSTPAMHSASGVVRDDGSYKPSFFTYATLIRQMQGVTPLQQLYSPDPNVRIYSWKRGAETFLTVWSVNGPAQLKVNIGSCLVTDAFGYRQEMNVAEKFQLNDYPVYLSKISDYDAIVKTLGEKEKEAKAAQQKENERLAKLKAYLFDFGVATTEETMVIGNLRHFTAVSSSDDEGVKPDFFIKGVFKNDEEPWAKTQLARTTCRMSSKGMFVFNVQPGRYHLRVELSPYGKPVRLTVNGGKETVERDLTQEDGLAEMDVEVAEGAGEMILTMSDFAALKWLTMIEKDEKKN